MSVAETENIKILERTRQETARKLDIDLTEPRQEGRIKALFALYKKYTNQMSICGFIYCEIIDQCNKLIDIYGQKKKKLNEIKEMKDNAFLLRTRLKSINYQFGEVIKDLEEKIEFNKELLIAYENKYVNNHNITSKHRTKLKELEDVCWKNWLRAIEVNSELRNTIIGFENRKALLALSKAYVDYCIFVDIHMKDCFELVKDLKKDGIIEYYEILRRYDLPDKKKLNFQLFLQKKIESKLSDAMELKTLFGSYLDLNYGQLDSAVSDLREQFLRDKKEILAVVNYYKRFLLQKQVLFTEEAEKLVLYLKKRYLEKIDFLCSRFQMYNAEVLATNKEISGEDLIFLKKVFTEEFDKHLNKLKIEYSKKFLPLLDNFFHAEEIVGSEHALDPDKLEEKMKELKYLKNLNLDVLVQKFEAEKKKIETLLDKNIDLISDVNKLNVHQFNEVLSRLKKDCELICCEILNLNNRYWVKANAEFNCEARRIFIKLRHKYSPWIKSWRKNSKPWMHEYLVLNMNHEVLKAVGEILEGYSPESDLYLKASKALLQYSEISRKIHKERDDMEAKQLLMLNRIPTPEFDELLSESNRKLDELKRHYENYWSDYNRFYNSLIS
ncbi:hypothetical protein MHC_05490 [Mycoplasma haemocanis str. Illinois]|uniref:Uncharacterized protein n=1 Tax=Mycoplasma haemocanis (strain Illinois) TaxID=1111676 RepID=H6N8I0_MYCHN|nr:hypothetical protein [Mycoplasma haemocanis]AEW45952.1 hypothetical protein MHC_05490 [Mycoplasma haemocanis str. Illinois]